MKNLLEIISGINAIIENTSLKKVPMDIIINAILPADIPIVRHTRTVFSDFSNPRASK